MEITGSSYMKNNCMHPYFDKKNMVKSQYMLDAIDL